LGLGKLLLSDEFKKKLRYFDYPDDLDPFIAPAANRLPVSLFRMDKGKTTFRHDPDPALLTPLTASLFSSLMPFSLHLLHPLEVNCVAFPVLDYVPFALLSIMSAFSTTSSLLSSLLYSAACHHASFPSLPPLQLLTISIVSWKHPAFQFDLI
jgi:hypothetical protein